MEIIAHRGAKGLAPENTLEAFKKAIAHHADQLEFDLRVTKDGVVVVNHDRSISGPQGGKLRIAECNFQELRRHKPDLMTFAALLQAIDNNTHLLIEIKPRVPITQIVRHIQSAIANGRPMSTISIGSFDQSILRAIHSALPDMDTVVIEHWSSIRAQLRCWQLHTKRINIRSWWLWRGFLRIMYMRGYQIAPYTLNNPARARKWEPYLYGVITDYPERFER